MGVFSDTLNVQPNIKFTDMNIWKLELKFYSADHRTGINLAKDSSLLSAISSPFRIRYSYE